LCTQYHDDTTVLQFSATTATTALSQYELGLVDFAASDVALATSQLPSGIVQLPIIGT
jgi:hypothetical protein